MLMITAVIQPFRLDQVRTSLQAADVTGLTVCATVGYGRNPTMVPSFKGGPNVPDLVPGIRIEVAVPTCQRDTAIEAIIDGARMGEHGDGKIFVTPLDLVVTIRTGTDEANLWSSHAHVAA